MSDKFDIWTYSAKQSRKTEKKLNSFSPASSGKLSTNSFVSSGLVALTLEKKIGVANSVVGLLGSLILAGTWFKDQLDSRPNVELSEIRDKELVTSILEILRPMKLNESELFLEINGRTGKLDSLSNKITNTYKDYSGLKVRLRGPYGNNDDDNFYSELKNKINELANLKRGESAIRELSKSFEEPNENTMIDDPSDTKPIFNPLRDSYSDTMPSGTYT